MSVFLGLPLLVVAAAVSGQLFDLGDIPTRAYLLLAAAGVIDSAVGRYTNYRALAAIGANRTSPMRAISQPYTLLMALIVLGERISIINGVGIVIVMIAPAAMLSRPGSMRRDTAQGGSQANPGEVAEPSTGVASHETVALPVHRLLEGYIFALLTALAWGTSPLLIREAIGDTGLGVLGALIAYVAAAVVLIPSLAVPGRLASFQHIDRSAMRWILLGGFAIFLAQMFRSVALDFSPVTLVSPLTRGTAIFSLFFAYWINRQIESFGPGVLVAIALSVVGSVFVVL